MIDSLVLLAPAKVNLTLDVFGRRNDGFHDIDSIIVPFTPADVVTLKVHPDKQGCGSVSLCCDDPRLPTGAGNLAYRAAVAFISRVECARASHIEIQLDKHLPFEAGLGGGSSDAATVLLGLAQIFDIRRTDLTEIAAAIGSDVPLFLEQAPVRMQGRGEVVTKIQSALPRLFGVFVKPAVGVPTGSAYTLLDARARDKSDATSAMFRALAAGSDVIEIGRAMHNDFEAAVYPAFPAVAAAYAAVTEAGAVRALLCGSGAAIFGLAQDESHARKLAKTLNGQFPYVEFAASFNRDIDAK